MLLAAALLAVLTSASNRPPTAGDGSGQALTVGLTTSAKGAPAGMKAKSGATATTTPSSRSAASGQTSTTTTAVAPESTTTVAAAGSAVEEAPEAEDGYEPEEVPARVQAAPPPVEEPEPAPAPVIAGLTRLPNVELEVLTLTNMDRGSNGVPPIARDSCMDAEASAWAYAMGESGTMAHSAAGGAVVQGCRGSGAFWGDNIGYWTPCYASEMEAWWMGSPSHRPHILDANFRAVGIGVWAQPDGRCWFQVYFGS